MLRTILPLAFIVATRFFGLFILLPVLSLYALNLRGANEWMVGFLIGIYALMQMVLQAPFGVLSDKIGRKKTLVIGLVIFIVGSIVCALANNIHVMIFGRFLQGCGAVGAVATALIADFTREEERGKAMAIMGGLIGISFGIATVLSPTMSAKWGLSSLFNLSAILTFLCIVLLFFVVPKEPEFRSFRQKIPFLQLLKDRNLLLMDLTNFFQKAFMTAAFFLIPILATQYFGFEKDELYKIYLPAMICGFIAMGASGVLGEKKGFAKEILLMGILFFIVAYAFFASNSKILFVAGVLIFFLGFNAHEPIMQSLASKFALSSQKGEVLGIFNSFGFFGSFVGGVSGGVLFSEIGILNLSIVVGILGILWFSMLLGLSNPKIFKNLYFEKGENLNFTALNGIKGIREVFEKDEKIVVKYHSGRINETKIYEILGVKNGI